MMDSYWSIVSTLQPHFKAILVGLLLSWSIGLELNTGIVSTTLSNRIEYRRALFMLSAPTFRGNVDADSASTSRLLRSTLSNVVVPAKTKDAFIFTSTVYSPIPSSTELSEKKTPKVFNPTDIRDTVCIQKSHLEIIAIKLSQTSRYESYNCLIIHIPLTSIPFY